MSIYWLTKLYVFRDLMENEINLIDKNYCLIVACEYFSLYLTRLFSCKDNPRDNWYEHVFDRVFKSNTTTSYYKQR